MLVQHLKWPLRFSQENSVAQKKIFSEKLGQIQQPERREAAALQNRRSSPHQCWLCIPSRSTHTHTHHWSQWSNTDKQHSYKHSSTDIRMPPIPSSCWHHSHTSIWPLVPPLWLVQLSLTPVSTVPWHSGTRTFCYSWESLALSLNLSAHGLNWIAWWAWEELDQGIIWTLPPAIICVPL